MMPINFLRFFSFKIDFHRFLDGGNGWIDGSGQPEPWAKRSLASRPSSSFSLRRPEWTLTPAVASRANLGRAGSPGPLELPGISGKKNGATGFLEKKMGNCRFPSFDGWHGQMGCKSGGIWRSTEGKLADRSGKSRKSTF